MVDAHTQCVRRAGRRHPLQKLFRIPPSLTRSHAESKACSSLATPAPPPLRGRARLCFFLLARALRFSLSAAARRREKVCGEECCKFLGQLAFAGDLRGANCSLKRRCPNILSDECGARAVRERLRFACKCAVRGRRSAKVRANCAGERERGTPGKLDADFRYLSLPLFEHEYVSSSKDPL